MSPHATDKEDELDDDPGPTMTRRWRTLLWTAVLVPCVAGAVLGDDAPTLVIDPGGHKAKIWDVMFTRDGRQLVSAGNDKVVRVWDVATRTSRHVLRGHTDVIYAVAFSSDGSRLASGSFDHTPAPVGRRDGTFAASTGTEVSVERKDWGHGAFTKAVLEGFSGRADGNGDGVIETLELGSWVVTRVKELTGGQQHALYQPSEGMPSFPLFALEDTP